MCRDRAEGDPHRGSIIDLIIAGDREDGELFVLYKGSPLGLTPVQFETFLELFIARFATRSGYTRISYSCADDEYARTLISRLRGRFSTLGPRLGFRLITTGVGTEFRLNLARDEVGICQSFVDDPPTHVVSPPLLQTLLALKEIRIVDDC